MDNRKQCSPSQHLKEVMPILDVALISSLFHIVNLGKKNKSVTTPLGKSFPLSRIIVKSTDNWTIWFLFLKKNKTPLPVFMVF